jgi:SAM-dependent methyltransferase
MSYLALAGHRSMVFDAVRTRAYAEALQHAVRPTSVVLDLGAGTGLFGLIAARLGARRVYLVEPEDILDVAAEIVRANGLERVVECLPGRVEDVRLPEPADLIVSVFTGNLLFSEDLLPSLFHARDHVLAPGGALVPSAARVEAVPVSVADVHAREIGVWASPPFPGVEMAVARGYAANALVFRTEGLREATWLAESQTLCTMDFYQEQYAGVHAEATFEVTASGMCHGWLGWFSIDLGGHWLSSSPHEPAVHWTPVLMPLDPPLAFEKGERVTFSLHRAPFADWFWSVKTGSTTQAHSTLLSTPMSAASLRRARPGYVPVLTGRGRAVRDLLDACDGAATVEALARELRVEHSDQFAAPGDAIEFVRSIVKRYA